VADMASLLYKMFDRHYAYEIEEQDKVREYLFPEEREVMKFFSTLKVNLTPLQEGLTRTVKWFIANENFYSDDGILSAKL